VIDVPTVRDAIAARRIFSVVHRDALQKVDIIVRDESDYEIEQFERRRQVEVDGCSTLRRCWRPPAFARGNRTSQTTSCRPTRERARAAGRPG
jgi:hypothetical protein